MKTCADCLNWVGMFAFCTAIDNTAEGADAEFCLHYQSRSLAPESEVIEIEVACCHPDAERKS